MGLLDQLKQQAEEAKRQQNAIAGAAEDSIHLVNRKLDETFRYFLELAKQLEVLRPEMPLPFHLQGVGDMVNMRLGEFSADFRKQKKGHDFSELIDRVTLTFNYTNPQKFVVERHENFQIERLKELLNRYAIRFDYDERKDNRGLVAKGIFTIPWEIRSLVLVQGDPEKRRIIFKCRNVHGLGEHQFLFDADNLDENILDQFSLFLMGQSNNFRKFSI